MGYINQFDLVRPIYTDEVYPGVVRGIMSKALKAEGVVSCVWHPTVAEMEQWSGNMKNYFFCTLQASLHNGLFTRDEVPVKGGLFSEWYNILQSVGVNID